MSIFTQSPARNISTLSICVLAILLLIVFEHAPLGNYWLTVMDIGIFFVPIFFLARVFDAYPALIWLVTLGLLKDLTSETPIGFWMLLFCVFYMLATSQRQFLFNARFRTVWTTFGLLTFLIYVVYYLVSLLHPALEASLLLTSVSAVATIISFPVFNLPFRWLSADDGQYGGA